MEHLIGGLGQLGWVAAKAILLYVSVVLGFRVSKCRTLAELSPFDFVAAVAIGAIVGRVPNASDASYLAGATTLVSVLATHATLTRFRRFPSLAHLVEHSPRVLMVDGRVLERELQRCGLTHADVYSMLRQRAVRRLSDVKYLILEPRGGVSVVSEIAQGPEAGSSCDLFATMLPRHTDRRTSLRGPDAPTARCR